MVKYNDVNLYDLDDDGDETPFCTDETCERIPELHIDHAVRAEDTIGMLGMVEFRNVDTGSVSTEYAPTTLPRTGWNIETRRVTWRCPEHGEVEEVDDHTYNHHRASGKVLDLDADENDVLEVEKAA